MDDARLRRVRVLALGVAVLTVAGCQARPGELREQWVRSNGKFKVRIQIYDEGNPAHVFERSCHVRLQTASESSEAWTQFGNAYFAPCDQNIKDQIGFVNDRTAYVFAQWWFRVTVDGGLTWNAVDIPAQLNGRVFYNARLIERVTINADGTGVMVLNPAAAAGQQRLNLRTDNYGQDWTLDR